MKRSIGGILAAALMPAQVVLAQPVGYEEALRAARADQPLLQAAQLRIDGTRDASQAADELPDPVLRGGITNLPITGPVAFEFDRQLPTQIAVGIEQPIPNLARRRARRGVAGADVAVAQMRLGVAQQRIDIATSGAWIDLYYAEEKLAFAHTALSDLRRLQPVANSAVASGAARPAESLAIRRELLVIEDAITRIEAERDAARAMLASYVRTDSPTIAGEAPAANVDSGSLEQALDLNPVIRLADAATGRAEANAGLARAELRPDFGVSVNYGRRDPAFGDAFSVMGSVTLPIFTDRRQKPRIRAAEAEAAAMQAERDDRLRALRVQFESDLASWRSAKRQWERARDELLPLARQRVELETASFAAGNADLIDVIAAKADLALLDLEIFEREAVTVEWAEMLRLTYGEQQP
ncbi:MAG: TolC family protein [Pseudomonadota bacterium]